jgi:hypothetical protein
MLPASTLLDSFKDTQTDARIVEEDDRYAIVAVRIDKTLIGASCCVTCLFWRHSPS